MSKIKIDLLKFKKSLEDTIVTATQLDNKAIIVQLATKEGSSGLITCCNNIAMSMRSFDLEVEDGADVKLHFDGQKTQRILSVLNNNTKNIYLENDELTLTISAENGAYKTTIPLEDADKFVYAQDIIAELQRQKAAEKDESAKKEMIMTAFEMKSCDFIDLISWSATAADSNSPNTCLRGTFLEFSKEGVQATSCDCFCIYTGHVAYPIETEIGIKDCLIPALIKAIVNRLPKTDELLKIVVNEKYICIESVQSKVKYYVKLLQAKFIDYKKMLELEFKTKVKINKDDVLSSINLCQAISTKNDFAVKFEVQDKKLVISDVERGSSSSECDIILSGEKVTIGYNASKIKEITNFTKKDLMLNLVGPKSLTVVSPIDMTGNVQKFLGISPVVLNENK